MCFWFQTMPPVFAGGVLKHCCKILLLWKLFEKIYTISQKNLDIL